ncbi:MAG TPA: GNAT family N-acetyltransferase [Candidatus Acidoferrales bacterium]
MLETARIRLLPWQPDDWLLLRPIGTDPQVMRYISDGEPWPDEGIREFVGRQVAHFDRLGYCLWKLLLKETSEMIGFCGLQPLDGTPETEIGWWLARACWGRGLATEAARTALQDGFERARLERIVAVALPDNRASIHVMEKMGMKYERDMVHRGFDVVLYALNRPSK